MYASISLPPDTDHMKKIVFHQILIYQRQVRPAGETRQKYNIHGTRQAPMVVGESMPSGWVGRYCESTISQSAGKRKVLLYHKPDRFYRSTCLVLSLSPIQGEKRSMGQAILRKPLRHICWRLLYILWGPLLLSLLAACCIGSVRFPCQGLASC